MKLLKELIRLFINKFVLKKSNGYCAKTFCINMGVIYIKLGQILAMQNINGVFSEDDRQDLLSICDSCNPVSFKEIKKIIKEEYKDGLPFSYIYKTPIGSASVSQVHKAILKDSDNIVAIKVKRRDIESTIEKDLAQIKFFVKHFGWMVNVTNLVGSYNALDFYLQWIKEEVNFIHEASNIESYTNFANSVNGKINGCTNIVIPKLYKEYCREDIIVLEYIPYNTISILKANKDNSDKINKAMESYIKLSFYALFNNIPVVWHGDPHAGNIYIDDNGNVGFLDMGLIFELTEAEQAMTLEFFFCAYFGDYERLYDMLEPYIKKEGEAKKRKFKHACKIYCKNIKSKPITSYFMDLVWVCLEYNISPPDFLYGMAKAFICLFGIDTVYRNTTTGKSVVEKQVIEYILKDVLNNGKELKNATVNIIKAILLDDKNLLIDSIQICNKELQYIKRITQRKGRWKHD